jgi:hypothetical protein
MRLAGKDQHQMLEKGLAQRLHRVIADRLREVQPFDRRA